MNGAIIVTAANVPPTVAITNPASGAVFAAPASVTIQASAADSDGTVTNVQFLLARRIWPTTRSRRLPPSPTIWRRAATRFPPLPWTTAAPQPPTRSPSASSRRRRSCSVRRNRPPGKFQFSYTANAGLSYIVQRSTNLLSANWTPLGTNLAAGSPINFTDTNATVNPGFYRVGRLPNP